jgi:hypothetical protein
MEEKKVNLVDFIHPKMDILFLALNAPEVSNNNAHWFTYNLSFWNLLFDSGLITQRINDKLEGDEKVFDSSTINYNNWIYGVTDLDKETVETDSTKIQTSTDQVKRILQILDSSEVKKLCIMHSKVADAFRSEGLINDGYGLVGRYKNTDIYNAPFHNASISDKPKYYSFLLGNISEAEIKEAQTIPEKLTNETKTILVKESPISKVATPLSGVKFTIPDVGNSITDADIKANHIRITVDLKRYFPRQSKKVTLYWNNEQFLCSYTIRDGKSNILSIGKKLVNLAQIKAGSVLRFQKIEDYSYTIEKIK